MRLQILQLVLEIFHPSSKLANILTKLYIRLLIGELTYKLMCLSYFSCFYNSTQLGRARAWLRLALMQKKLADYFRILIEQKDALLAEYYEPRALLRSEEAVLITGLLFSLNIVDCNLCVKVNDLKIESFILTDFFCCITRIVNLLHTFSTFMFSGRKS